MQKQTVDLDDVQKANYIDFGFHISSNEVWVYGWIGNTANKEFDPIHYDDMNKLEVEKLFKYLLSLMKE